MGYWGKDFHPDASRVAVRVIRTDEDLMIARSVCRILKTDTGERIHS